ncbi:MAG TPA: DCC1-like thiol-disulfide oxidoreductase family protein [Steroidobacteraceae bacterium]|nr:DCC1-like thiol-disulfide oxidoreductase family protein [Steroidobacteraceae bacterium]
MVERAEAQAVRIIVYDGYCHLCSGWARFHHRHPTTPPFDLVAMQSRRGRELLTIHGVDPDDPTTFLVLDGGMTFTQSDAAIQVMIASGGLWRLASLARWVPSRLRDGVYGVVARNRYRWFGKRTSCYLPP